MQYASKNLKAHPSFAIMKRNGVREIAARRIFYGKKRKHHRWTVGRPYICD